jgi:ATP-binding cassette subfamily B protein
MAWGGGWGGGPGGGGFGGPHSASQTGLPFGGIPTELQDLAAALLADEPEHEPSQIRFTQLPRAKERQRLSLFNMIRDHRSLALRGSIMVVLISLTLQCGPLLTAYAVDHGMSVDYLGHTTHIVSDHRSLTVVAVCAVAYLLLALLGALFQRHQVNVTGRLASRVMHDLRIRVFTHYQRLSLDFFTDEKAGVLMSRMTSDIENLQQLLQDGISQFALQGLTMIVITIVLFSINVTLAAWIILGVVPILVLMSIWFHRASERGYLRSRDGIANVLSDLSESLYGIRVVTAHNRQRQNIVDHRRVVGAYRDANLYTGRVNALYGPGTIMIGILGQALLLGVGGDMVLHGHLSVGSLFAFFLYLNRFFQPIQLLVQQYNLLQQGAVRLFACANCSKPRLASTRAPTPAFSPRSRDASPSTT